MRPILLLSACCDAARSSGGYSRLMPELTEVDTPQPGADRLSGCPSYPWRLENKYYVADIDVVDCPEPTLGNQEFADATEAVGLYFCSSRPACYARAQAWLPYLQHLEPEVRFLVCDRVSGDAREQATAWCVANGFELIELDEGADQAADDDDDDDDFGDSEANGVARMRQALHSHTWPNLRLHDRRPQPGPAMQELRRQLLREAPGANGEAAATATANGEAATVNGDASDGDGEATAVNGGASDGDGEAATATAAAAGPIVDEQLLSRVYDDGEADETARRLESLFAAVMQAKSDADQLPVHSEQRRQLAASVMTRVWQELGVSDEEADDSD